MPEPAEAPAEMPIAEMLNFSTEALLCATVGDEVSYAKNLRKMTVAEK